MLGRSASLRLALAASLALPSLAWAQTAPNAEEPAATATDDSPAEADEVAEDVAVDDSETVIAAGEDGGTIFLTPHDHLCAESAAELAGASVVRVESGTAVGSGFLVGDASHVVTAFRLVRDGHDVRVIDREGNARSAEVVVTAPDDDLALLQLRTPLASQALTLAHESELQVGMRVVAIGNPFVQMRQRVALGARTEGLFGQAISEGIVSAVGARTLQTDTQLGEGSVGGALVDCHGRVVAAMSTASLGMHERVFIGASSSAVADLLTRAEHPESYQGRISGFLGLGLAMAYEDPGMPWGAYLQLGLNVLDSFVLSGRFHYLQRDDQPLGTSALDVFSQRYRGDAFVAWRQLVTLGTGMGFWFELGAGASVTSLHQRTRSGTIDTTGTPTLVVTESSLQRWSVRPMLVLDVQMGPIVLGYTVELDVDALDVSGRAPVQHLLDLGTRF